MLPALDDAAVLDDEDLVGGEDGGEAVRDEDAAPGVDEGLDRILDRLLGNGVEGGGRLIEDKERRVF